MKQIAIINKFNLTKMEPKTHLKCSNCKKNINLGEGCTLPGNQVNIYHSSYKGTVTTSELYCEECFKYISENKSINNKQE